MDVCGVTDLGASPGQMSVILEGTAVVGEVIIQTFGAMDVSMLMLLAFLIYREHLLWIVSLSLAYRADSVIVGKFVGWLMYFPALPNCVSIFHSSTGGSSTTSLMLQDLVFPVA